MKISATLYRDLPGEGWQSMEVYADALIKELTKFPQLSLKSFSPWDPTITMSGQIGKVIRYSIRFGAYPWLARMAQSGINHIIDHSYGHLVNALDKKRTIVTMHDIAPLAFDRQQTKPGIAYKMWEYAFRNSLKAERILVDSQFTKDEVLKHTNIDAQKLTVIPLGYHDDVFIPLEKKNSADCLRQKYKLPAGKLILHVGSCVDRKNIETIIQAIPIVRSQTNDPISFLQVGGCFTSSQKKLIEDCGQGNAVFQIPFIAHKQLVDLYQTSDVFVFPSLYEGFGMPVVEAMACGLPVISSNAASLPEVVGDAALQILPTDFPECAHQIIQVISNPDLAASLTFAGLKRSKAFTWKHIAERTVAVYRELLNHLEAGS